jgi:hypothetical protein
VLKNKLENRILCESEDLFMNGSMIDTEHKAEPAELDYTRNYTVKLKKVEDMYVPEDGDEVISMDKDITLIKSEDGETIKKVLTEDFLVKDFRRRILSKEEK